MPINPINPSKKTSGDGSEKYTPPKKKLVPSDYDKAAEKVDKEKAAEKARAELSKIAEEHKAKTKAESPRTYTERLQDMGRIPKPSVGGGSAGAGGDFSGMKGLDKPFKNGGKVSNVSKRADGCAIKGKTKGRIV
jgi:ABC-type Fe3+-hydroxamate transport system substrate-binding protein